MKKIILLFTIGILFVTSCGKKKPIVNAQVTVADTEVQAGLDLDALSTLIAESSSTKELEVTLNESNGINNLDLDEDGKVDYLIVNDYGTATEKEIIISGVYSDGNLEVATINVTNQGDVYIAGNETVYGSGAYYQSRVSIADWMLFNYMFSPRYRPYYSPYRYGYYPTYYSPYRPIAYSAYRTQRVNTVTSRSTKTIKRTSTKPTRKSSVASSKPNNLKNTKKSNSVAKKQQDRRKVSDGKTSQKSFAKRDDKKPVEGGGFGNKKKDTSKPSSRSSANKAKPKPKSSSAKPKPKSKPKSSFGSSKKKKSSFGSKKSGGRKKH